MKHLLQIIAALLYSSIFVSLLALVTIAPMAWFFSLPVFWMVIIYLFFFGLFQGLMAFARTVISIPYAWIVKGNGVALGISIISVIGGMVLVCIRLWRLGPHGFWQIAAFVVMTILLIEVILGTISSLISLYSDTE